ncbi:MAG: hypothetical protein GY943_20225, partial [Chloroflexi bacterium]|nr:hypothetical protein [Chloroflexota bacterium]
DALVWLDSILMEAAPGNYPNPVAVNFEDQFTLLGYELMPRRLQADETTVVTLYWKVERSLDVDYTFFAQVVDDDTTRWAAHDLAPAVKTSEWQPGDVQSISMNLTLREDTPAAVYPIIVGIYSQTPEGQFERLQMITEDGRPTDDFLRLTLLRVD